MESYKRKAVAKSIEIRSKRLKKIKGIMTFFYWFIPSISMFFCVFILYQNGMIPFSIIKESKEIIATVDERKGLTQGGYSLDSNKELLQHNLVQKSIEDQIEENQVEENQIDENNLDDIAGNHDDIIEQKESIKIDELAKENQGSLKPYSNKKVYLTFDDGPTKNTEKVLDILLEYNVKATFFVIGKTDEYSLSLYSRIVNEGHVIAIHSYTHNYDSIYKSLEDFQKDFTKLRDLLYDTTGYLPNLYRFPGGSATLVGKNIFKELVSYLNEENYIYHDWNVVNGDATGQNLTAQQLIDNTIRGVEAYDESIVLMHDSHGKDNTVSSLSKLLEILIDKGAAILPLDNNVEPIQQLKLNY